MYLLLVLCVLLAGLCTGDDLLHYPDYVDHPCVRDCTYATQMTCSYEFNVEMMYSMNRQCKRCLQGDNADCFNEQCIVTDGERLLLKVINRLLPGPQIQVCFGDVIEVLVKNHLPSEITSIHWHGIDLPGANPMDGVPQVTQCPILPGTHFLYRFNTTQRGTYFYHSHIELQRSVGVFGPLIIRDAKDPYCSLYDYDLAEHSISLTDWTRDGNEVMIEHYELLHDDITPANISAIMINGFAAIDGNKVPPLHFTVQHNKHYRFRLMHVGANECPIKFSIDNHQMLVIAVDGHDIKPIRVNAVVMTSGERVDFILRTNRKPKTYWIRAEGVAFCGNLTGLAYLDYELHAQVLSKDLATASTPTSTKQLLGYFDTIHADKSINYDEVKTVEEFDERLVAQHADFQFYMHTYLANFVPITLRGIGDDAILTPNINNITFAMPARPLIFQNGHDHDPFCNITNHNKFCGKARICNCLHVVELPVNKVIEILMLNVREQTSFFESHPMHLHGHTFSVLAIGKTNATTLDELKRLDRLGLLKRQRHNPALKDTLALPNYGYAILRFISSNPGYWNLHCHVNLHLYEGMMMVFKVGDFTDLPHNFPRCGNFD